MTGTWPLADIAEIAPGAGQTDGSVFVAPCGSHYAGPLDTTGQPTPVTGPITLTTPGYYDLQTVTTTITVAENIPHNAWTDCP